MMYSVTCIAFVRVKTINTLVKRTSPYSMCKQISSVQGSSVLTITPQQESHYYEKYRYLKIELTVWFSIRIMLVKLEVRINNFLGVSLASLGAMLES